MQKKWKIAKHILERLSLKPLVNTAHGVGHGEAPDDAPARVPELDARGGRVGAGLDMRVRRRYACEWRVLALSVRGERCLSRQVDLNSLCR